MDFTSPNVSSAGPGRLLHHERRARHGRSRRQRAWRLPWGEFKTCRWSSRTGCFDPDGQLYFDLFNFDGRVGDKMVVNGAIQPSFQVQARRHRFRWLAGGPARFWQFHLPIPPTRRAGFRFQVIAAGDGTCRPQSYESTNVRLSVAGARRCDCRFLPVPPGTSTLPREPPGAEVRQRPDRRSSSGRPRRSLGAIRRGAGNSRRMTVRRVRTSSARRRGPGARGTGRRQSAHVAVSSDAGACWSAGRLVRSSTATRQRRRSPWKASREVWVFQNNSGGWQHLTARSARRSSWMPGAETARRRRRSSAGARGRGAARLRHRSEGVHASLRDFTGRYMMHCRAIPRTRTTP
ncbi:MAG: hypothetical protein MZW92_36920 [Comamonadaceae bacterium]|nr:hypothetical protein [Comamonadaceae bacterium]